MVAIFDLKKIDIYCIRYDNSMILWGLFNLFIPKIKTRKPKRVAWLYSTHGVNIKIWKKYHFTLDFAQNVQ